MILSEIRPIRSEADCAAALSEVEWLWGARSGTPEGDRLDVLATLIDAYENERHPIDPAARSRRWHRTHTPQTPMK
jgi:HTH-type transcriptional regulator/antitoxin HigA